MSEHRMGWISAAVSIFLALPLVGCGPELSESEDEAPVDLSHVIDEGDGEEELGTLEGELSAPLMRMPFRCGQVWAAQTRASHSPQLAVDFNRDNDYGDDVVASAPGTVTRAEHEGNVSYGLWVEIAHANGYRTRYAHLSRRTVSVGQHVDRSQKIGEVGNSGSSTGAHLHYEQRHNGSTIRVRLGHNAVDYFGWQTYRSRNGC